MAALKPLDQRKFVGVYEASLRLMRAGYAVDYRLASIQYRAIGIRSKLVIYPNGIDEDALLRAERKA